jgi:hypothetical protein
MNQSVNFPDREYEAVENREDFYDPEDDTVESAELGVADLSNDDTYDVDDDDDDLRDKYVRAGCRSIALAERLSLFSTEPQRLTRCNLIETFCIC